MTDISVPLNRDLAYNIMIFIPDPKTRTLVNFALTQATLSFVRLDGESIEEYHKKLPTAPFDMKFFTEIMQEVFSKKEALESILHGQIRVEDIIINNNSQD